MEKSKKKKDSRKRRLLLLILLLVGSIIMLSSATYAWFTSNRTVDVDSLNVDVRATDGLEISANAIDWSARVTIDDLKEAADNGYGANQLPDVLTHASSDGVVKTVGSNDGRLNIFTGNTSKTEDGDYTLSLSQPGDKAKCYDDDDSGETCDAVYVAYDLYFKLESDDDASRQIVLTSESSVTKEDSDSGIKNTARVAFIVEGYATLDEYYSEELTVDDATMTGEQYIRSLNEGSESIIWEPNFADHNGSNAKKNALNNYGIDLSTDYSDSAVPYYGANQVCSGILLNSFKTDQTAGGCFTKVTPTITDTSSDVNFIVLKPGVTKVRVYFWVEGNDVDAENSATGAGMNLNLQFAIAS